MADKTPVRVVFNASSVATGLAEFQSGDTIGTAFGGTGLTSIGSAGQILKVNAAGSGLEFAAEGDVSITNLVAPTNADLTFTTSGTGNIVLDAITVRGTTLSAADSSSININEGLIVDGTLNVSGQATLSGLAFPTSDGSADQFLKTDGSGTLSFANVSLGDFSFVGSTISSPSNADLTLDPSGSGSIKLNAATDITGAMTATSITSNDFTSNGSNADITIAPQGTGDINLTAGADVNIPANIGITFGDDAEKIEGDGTDLTISGNNINLTAVADVNIPSGVGLTFATAEKIESDGTDLSITVGSNGDINIPANIGLTFGDDGEKIEGDGTDLTITGNNIKLTATADVIIPTNVGLHFTDANEKIESDGSKLVITSGGTAFNLPTSDGTNGQALVTDGAGTLSFGTVSTTVSDDTLATVRNNKSLGSAARTIDSINATFIDSAFYFLVHNDIVNEVISAELFAVTNNDSASFLGNRRGIESAGGSTVPTLSTDVSNGQFRVRAVGSSSECKASFYKVAMSSSTTDATRGNTVTSSNTDVDSSSESIDTFAHATFRGAKYFISVDNDSKTEMDVVEALVVHDGSDAYIKSFGHTRSGSNTLISLTAAISGDNVVVSAAGNEPNLNITMHKILLKDNMTAESNANQKAFASVTISSTATAIDLMDLDDANGAVYFIVGANSSEGAYSIQEVYTAATPGVPAVANGPFVSTKSSSQVEFTAGFDTATENSLELFASSTSGGSTTVSGYRISALAG